MCLFKWMMVRSISFYNYQIQALKPFFEWTIGTLQDLLTNSGWQSQVVIYFSDLIVLKILAHTVLAAQILMTQ